MQLHPVETTITAELAISVAVREHQEVGDRRTVADNLTRYLNEWTDGSDQAGAALMPLVYEQMRHLARIHLSGERSADTLQATGLVHEVYLRLRAQTLPNWQDRAHFFGVVAHLMRQILVDHARRRTAVKRGGGEPKARLEEALNIPGKRDSSLLALDDALSALARLDPRECQIIELRYFAGLTLQETADALGISVATVRREQSIAVAWLSRELRRERSEPGERARTALLTGSNASNERSWTRTAVA
jgi:RNA polymerase sigma-70 factor, ECF subfamily